MKVIKVKRRLIFIVYCDGKIMEAAAAREEAEAIQARIRRNAIGDVDCKYAARAMSKAELLQLMKDRPIEGVWEIAQKVKD